MLRSYFKIAWRSILRQRLYSVINIAGLCLGITSCLIIYTITTYEFGFDSFHTEKDRIYRVIGEVTESNGSKLNLIKLPIPLIENARTHLSGVEVIAGIIPYNAKIKINEPNRANEFESKIERFTTTVIAEPQYFTIFKYQWLVGNAATALKKPHSVVITESRAQHYFGTLSPDKIIGKQITYDDSLIVNVTGVVKDWKGNSDLSFSDFISFPTIQTSFLSKQINTESWKRGDLTCWVFAKLSDKMNVAEVNNQLKKSTRPYVNEIKLTPWLQSLSDIHFNSDLIENPIRIAHLPTLYSLIGIALFILLLAIINFINLSTAQSMSRAKEVGVRKVLGSGRLGLSFQFLTEIFLLTVIATLLSIALVDPILSQFQSFIPRGVRFDFFDLSTSVVLIIVIFFTTLISGLYPATVLSSYKPAISLKGVALNSGKENWSIRKGLIVFQFSVSLLFIMGSIVIWKQLNFTREKDLGFNAEAIVMVDTPGGEPLDKIVRFTERVKTVPGISQVALQWVPPMVLNGRSRNIKFNSTDENSVSVVQIAGNEDFIPLYQIKLLAGRNLKHADSLTEFVINESLVHLLGYKKPEEALGRVLYWDDKPYPVVGVVTDFHTRSLHEAIAPLCIVNRPDRETTLAIKFSSKGKNPDFTKETLLQVEEVWKKLYPQKTFNYSFYDDSLALLYESDQRTAMLINMAMAVAIFISCIGLFGLTLFSSERRSKEISIRKILGASVSQIVAMLSKEFLVLIITSILIASPIAIYFMNLWLQGFAYHITINWTIFFLAGGFLICIALATTSYQSINAALTNPVKNLKSE